MARLWMLFLATVALGQMLEVAMASRVQAQSPEDGSEVEGGNSESQKTFLTDDCIHHIMGAQENNQAVFSAFIESCTIDSTDLERVSAPDSAFSVTLDGRSKLCHPQCQAASGLDNSLPDLETLQKECTDAASVQVLAFGLEIHALAAALQKSWKSCGTTSMQHLVRCECGFSWNSFQRAFALMVGTGHTTPQQRSAMYHRFRRECGCIELEAKGPKEWEPIADAAGEGTTDDDKLEEARTLRQLLLLEHINQVVLKPAPTSEDIDELFKTWAQVSESSQLDVAEVQKIFNTLREYQGLEIKEGKVLKKVNKVTAGVLDKLKEKGTGSIIDTEFAELFA